MTNKFQHWSHPMHKKDCVQLWHPMRKFWTVVDRTTGHIVRHSPKNAKPYKDIKIVLDENGVKH